MRTIKGIDGRVPAYEPLRDGCCPPTICSIDWCGLICNFIQMLPRGPLWDQAKATRLSAYAQCGLDAACDWTSCERPTCASLVDHSIYAAKRLLDVLASAVWPAIRESDPWTAHDTLDDWLDRLGWQDCFDCACRDPSIKGLTPIDVMGVEEGCDLIVCCPPTFPDELICAVKQGVVRSLARLQLGVVRNLDAINFVIEPLGAKLEASCYRYVALDPMTCNEDDGVTLEVCPAPTIDATDPWLCKQQDVGAIAAQSVPTWMRQWEFKICPLTDVLPACVKLECDPDIPLPRASEAIEAAASGAISTVQAYYEPDCNDTMGLPSRIYPGVMAAECIVRSMLPLGSRISIVRCC